MVNFYVRLEYKDEQLYLMDKNLWIKLASRITFFNDVIYS